MEQEREWCQVKVVSPLETRVFERDSCMIWSDVKGLRLFACSCLTDGVECSLRACSTETHCVLLPALNAFPVFFNLDEFEIVRLSIRKIILHLLARILARSTVSHCGPPQAIVSLFLDYSYSIEVFRIFKTLLPEQPPHRSL